MKPLLANWTIVLAGRWNMEILNPEWVTQKVFEKQDAEIDLVMDGMQTRLRYRFDNLAFVPSSSNVIFSVEDMSADSLNAIEGAACKLLSALPVTPITALGINFTFVEDDPAPNILRIFNISDTSDLADYGLGILRTRVRREIDIGDRQLNLLFSQIEDGKVRIALNYHFPTNETIAALEKLAGHVCRLRDHGVSLLNNVYDLSIDETPGE